jgi:signal transduction histidine kinase/ligand-binding sensor domain-containing protein
MILNRKLFNQMKNLVSALSLLLIFLILEVSPVYSQEIVFNKVPPPVGKTFLFVTGIAQDLNGIMWFSTKTGLYSYDGNRLILYESQPLNPNSLISNTTESIYVDKNGIIWVGTLGKGLDRFDPETGKFTHFHHDPKKPASLANDTVTAILRDKQGTLWIGTHGGLDYFDEKENKFFHYQYKEKDPTSLSNNQVRVIYEDSQGSLWIGTGSPYADNGGGPNEGGLNRLDKKIGTFTRYLHDPKNIHSLISNKISAIFEDNKGVLWIGASLNGLHKMNKQQGTFERIIFDPKNPEKLSAPAVNTESTTYEHITFFTQDAAGSYWFGTVDAGLFYFNPAIGKIKHYSATVNPSSGFTDYGAWKAFTSHDGIFWIGGTQGTIYHFNPLQEKIPNILVSSAPVNSLYEEQNGTFWIGATHALIQVDKKNGTTKRFEKEINSAKGKDNDIYSLWEDRQNNLWVGSYNGLYFLDRVSDKFKSYKNNPKDENSISSNSVTQVYEDSKSNFWICTFRGLNLLDRGTDRFKHYLFNPADTNGFGSNLMTSIFEDKYGKLWVGGWNGSGINLFNRENATFITYLRGSGIMCIYEDSAGVLWVGGNDGLYKYNHEADNFIRVGDFDLMNGIPDVYNLIEDNQNYLWIGTAGGILRVNPQRNETTFFGENFGIAKNSLTWGSVYKGRNGNLYFGNNTGYYVINPEELLKKSKSPEIVFSDFKIADVSIKPEKYGTLKKNLSETKEIRLQYNQKVFSFDFTVIDYANPEQNQLIYYLENFDKTWLKASSERKAYYFNIPPGKYIFHVKAVNGYGAWAEKSIEIIILPPWWRSWWAYGFYALLLIAAVFAFDRFMRRRIVLAERKRAQERELVHAKEIEKAYTELKETQTQLIQSEKMASLGELTAGIAHEIQNPLNFVNNFSEVNTELIEEMKQEIEKGNMEEVKAIANDIADNEQKITQHGKRADAIVKGMLQHSRSSTGVKEPASINALADEYLRLAYHGLRAKDKSFNATMKTDFDESIGNINIIPQDIGRVILNLITNAFYTVTEKKQQLGDGYEPTVSVSTKKAGNKVLISVKDNGNGIPDSVLDKIYQPFFTTKPSGQGTGLGLSMSYEIITKAHGGELKVESKNNEGAEFTIILPV